MHLFLHSFSISGTTLLSIVLALMDTWIHRSLFRLSESLQRLFMSEHDENSTIPPIEDAACAVFVLVAPIFCNAATVDFGRGCCNSERLVILFAFHKICTRKQLLRFWDILVIVCITCMNNSVTVSEKVGTSTQGSNSQWYEVARLSLIANSHSNAALMSKFRPHALTRLAANLRLLVHRTMTLAKRALYA